LQAKLFGARSELRGGELLEVANGVVFVALDTDFFAQSIVQDYFNHGYCGIDFVER
jgi:hypothetical protein